MPIRCQSKRLGLIQMLVGITSSQKVVTRKKNSQLTLCVVQFDGTALINDPEALATGMRLELILLGCLDWDYFQSHQ